MDIDIKVVNAAIVAGTPALVIALGAFFTAKLVTARLETQKQHLELYKTLYLERIAAAKKLTEMAGKVHLGIADHITRLELGMARSEENTKETNQTALELVTFNRANRWLLGEEVYNASEQVLGCYRDYSGAHSAGRGDVMRQCVDVTLEKITLLNEAVYAVMLSDDLERFVGKRRR
ncbi:MAG: hypothetical protein V4671_09590 [Armatimonadota bacterium]